MVYEDTVKIMLNRVLIKNKVEFSQIEALLLRAHKDIIAARANYDPFLPVSKSEAENALKTAKEFVKIVLKLVQKENPQLR